MHLILERMKVVIRRKTRKESGDKVAWLLMFM